MRLHVIDRQDVDAVKEADDFLFKKIGMHLDPTATIVVSRNRKGIRAVFQIQNQVMIWPYFDDDGSAVETKRALDGLRAWADMTGANAVIATHENAEAYPYAKKLMKALPENLRLFALRGEPDIEQGEDNGN